MATYVTFHIKSFNDSRIIEELNALSLTFATITWAGFLRPVGRVRAPTTGPTEVGRKVENGVTTIDTADPGELRFVTSVALTGAQQTALDAALVSHDSTQLSAEQVREDQDEVDWAVLEGSITDYKAHLLAWDGYNNLQAKAASKEMLTSLGKAVRLLIRQNRGSAI